MPSIARSSIISGPARITYGGQQFWSKGDVQFRVINERFNIETAHFGKVDERSQDRRIEIQFEPSGRFTAALAAVLWPYASTNVGTSIFGAADSALTINGRDGRQIVVHAAAVTTMPTIRLAVNQTICGPVTFTGILKNSTDPTAAAAYYTESAVAYPGDTGFAVSDIITKAPVAAWGLSSPWNSFQSENGWTIEFDLQLTPMLVDGLGTVDMKFSSLAVSAKAIPVGPTAADVLTKLAGTSGLGASVATANQLLLENGDAGAPSVALTGAALVDGGLNFGAQSKRLAECTWIATRTITGGSPNALFAIGVSGV